MAYPDAWEEFVRIGVMKEDGSEVMFDGLTDDISFELAEKDIEGISLNNGGSLVKRVPYGGKVSNVTMKAYPVNCDLSGNGVSQFFHPQSTDDTTDPIVITATTSRKRHKLVYLWATTLPTSASTPPAAGVSAYRIQVVNAYMTKCNPSWDDKVLSYEMQFKWTTTNKSAVGNMKEESTLGTTQLGTATTSAITWV